MENKKEISLEDFMSNSWSRLKQLILAENVDVKDTEQPAVDDVDNDRQLEEGEDQDENEDESESEEYEINKVNKYTEYENLDESQYDEETKLIVEGKC